MEIVFEFIPEENIGKLIKKVESLNKKAKKLGISSLVLEKTEEFYKAQEELGFVETKYIKYKLTGEPITINGWEVISQIEHLQEGNVVKTFVREELMLSEKYKDSNCEHCNLFRYRNKTYIVRNIETGELKQIGSSCVKDFVGSINNPESILNFYSYLKDLPQSEEIDEWKIVDPFANYLRRETVLRQAAERIILDGFLSNSVSGNKSTSKMVILSLDLTEIPGVEIIPIYPETDKGKEMIEMLNEYLNYLEQKTYRSDYENNILVVLNNNEDRIKIKYVGIAVAAVYSAFTWKTSIESKTKNGNGSSYVGKVGDKITSEVVFETSNTFETAYGRTNLMKFKDSNGNILCWFNSGKNYLLAKGSSCLLSGTVKSHQVYNNEKQTVLTRCKVN